MLFGSDLVWAVIQVVFWGFFALPLLWASARAIGHPVAQRTAPWLDAVADGIDRLNRALGTVTFAAALGLVLVQIAVVLLRYVFRIGLIELQELIIYGHALLFMAGSGYALLRGAHVRVDIFYRDAPPPRKALVNVLGVYLLLMPSMALLFYVAWPYVGASWLVLEGSKEASGLPVYPLKTLLLVFPVSVMLQGWALVVRSLRGAPLEERTLDQMAVGAPQ